MTESHFARFWSFVDIRGPRECWEWTGTRNRQGYGMPDAGIQIAFGGEAFAYRVALACFRPRPEGATDALHCCDNPPCCNPRHLRWGSEQENHDDMRIAEWTRRALASRRADDLVPERDDYGNPWSVKALDERAPSVFRRGLKRVDEATVRAIRADFAAGMSVLAIALKHGLTRSHTDSIAKGRIWKHVGFPSAA